MSCETTICCIMLGLNYFFIMLLYELTKIGISKRLEFKNEKIKIILIMKKLAMTLVMNI